MMAGELALFREVSRSPSGLDKKRLERLTRPPNAGRPFRIVDARGADENDTIAFVK